jgi:hypothetical protein
MKKVIIPLIAALAFSSAAKAELEVSGNVTTMTVYQHDDQDAGLGAGGITQGDLGIADAANADHFRFLVDQVELDLENEFGENIRARADVDFRDVTGTTIRGAGNFLDLEQGYVTANIGVGNGLEFLMGKFNAPLGLELNDRHENVFSTYTPGYQYLTPKSLIGTKLYYEFNDNWSMDVGVVNNLNGAIAGNSAMPSAIVRVGAMWGDEGNESYIHVGGAVGPELVDDSEFDYYGTAWGNFSIGDFWDIGWDYQYRQTTVAGAVDQKAMGGQLYGVFQASDVWTVQARAAALWEINPATAGGASTTGTFWNSGFEGVTYSGTAGATYQITDDAQMKLEYRFDFARTAGATADADYHTGVAELAYSF